MLLTARRAAAALCAALCAALALTAPGSAAPVPADRLKAEQAQRAERLKAEKELAVVAARLHGTWECLPCEGRLTLRPDGSYEWADIANRGGLTHRGTWTLRGPAAAPLLALHCAAATVPGGGPPDDVQGRTLTWKFAMEDADSLTFEEPTSVPFARAATK